MIFTVASSSSQAISAKTQSMSAHGRPVLEALLQVELRLRSRQVHERLGDAVRPLRDVAGSRTPPPGGTCRSASRAPASCSGSGRSPARTGRRSVKPSAATIMSDELACVAAPSRSVASGGIPIIVTFSPICCMAFFERQRGGVGARVGRIDDGHRLHLRQEPLRVGAEGAEHARLAAVQEVRVLRRRDRPGWR